MVWPFGRWRGERPKRQANCSFCVESYTVVGPLVEGPDEYFICYGCAQRAAKVFAEEPTGLGKAPYCSFCRKLRRLAGPFFTADGANAICRECVEAVVALLEAERSRRGIDCT